MHVAELTNGVRLRRRKYQPAAKPEENENRTGNYLLVLPLGHGRIKLERDDAVVHDGLVQPGTLRIVKPRESSRMAASSAFEAAMFTVPAENFHRAASAHSFPLDENGQPNFRPVMQARYDIQRLVPLLGTASELCGQQRDLLISGLVLALMALVLSADPAQQVSGFEDGEFEAVLRFAKARQGEHLDLGEWADFVGLSTNEFARRFQQHTGVAPYTWFMDRRIDEAKRLMTSSDMPLVEIALESGFCSQSHFTEAFRRRVGTSPGRWRSAKSARLR